MAASEIITIKQGIPVIMGSNVGTSITSSMISLTSLNKIGKKKHQRNSLTSKSLLEEYKSGFTAAIMHDLFNWCTILVLLPIEIGTGALEKLTGR